MTSIDRVYGVTMTQKGISDIVSVDFDKTRLKEAVWWKMIYRDKNKV